MKPGEIILTTTLQNGEELIFRYPQQGDALLLCNYINKLSSEKTFIYYQGEQQSLEEEDAYLQSVLNHIFDSTEVYIMVLHKDTIVAASQITMQKLAEKHIGVFGISVAKEWRGKGIGGMLMKLVHDKSTQNLPQLEIVRLSVFADNAVAYQMYKKFGYVEFGKLPEGLIHGSKKVDQIYMYKKLERQQQ